MQNVMTETVELSIVTSIYEAATYVEAFYARMRAAALALGVAYEFVFVNDGSRDESLQVLRRLQTQDARVVVVDLSRNFGQHRALWAGLKEARGAHVFVIDADLEEAPEHVVLFWQQLHASGADMVFAAQKSRNGPLWTRVTGGVFYALVEAAVDFPVVKNVLMMRLMRRHYVDAILQFQERDPRLTIIAYIAGFRTECIPIEKRYKGFSTYSFNKKLREACDYMVGISSAPLYWLLYAALAVLGMDVLWGLGLEAFGVRRLLPWIFWGMGCVTGVLMLCIGVAAVYLARVLLEARQSPLLLVRAVYRAK